MGGTVRPPTTGIFPLAVAGVCATLAVLLFLTNTVPAVRESDDLRRAADDRLDLLRQLIHEADDLSRRQQALDWDPQTLLLEIDRLGLTPQELLDATEDPR